MFLFGPTALCAFTENWLNLLCFDIIQFKIPKLSQILFVGSKRCLLSHPLWKNWKKEDADTIYLCKASGSVSTRAGRASRRNSVLGCSSEFHCSLALIAKLPHKYVTWFLFLLPACQCLLYQARQEPLRGGISIPDPAWAQELAGLLTPLPALCVQTGNA